MAAIFWTNVQVDAQTVLGTALTVTAITKANPAVVSSTAHGLTNGDFVVMSVAGMVEIHDRVFRVAGVTTDTFQLEGEDSTTYGTFSSGSAQEITFGVSASTLQDVQVSGGEPEFADVSTIHEQIKRRVPTTKSPLTMSFTSLFDGSDAFLAELRKADNSLTKRAIQIRFSNGTRMVGNAYVSASGAPTGTAGQAVQTPISLEMQGMPKVYSA